MKKKFLLAGVLIIVFAAAGAGIAAHNAAGNASPVLPDEAQHEEKMEDVKETIKEGTDNDQGYGNDGDEANEEQELKKTEGTLTGRIDSHSVEIEVAGQPRAFGLSEALQQKEFAPGTITFQYYVDSNGRSIITEADFQKPRQAEVHTAEGVFQGLADNHTAEIKIDGGYMAFALAEHITFTGIAEGEEIFIAYQENEQGRQEIIKIEKIF